MADKHCLTPDDVYSILCLCTYKHAHTLSTTQLYIVTCKAAAIHENNVTNLPKPPHVQQLVWLCKLWVFTSQMILHLLKQLAVQSILIH